MGMFDDGNNHPDSLQAGGVNCLTKESSYLDKVWQGLCDLALLTHELSLNTDDPEPWWVDVADHIEAARAVVEQGVGK